MNPGMTRADRPHRLLRFLAGVRERWWMVVLTIVVLGGLAFGVSLMLPPRYGATAQLTYSPRDAQLISKALSSSDTAAALHNISSDALPLQTSAFAQRVSKAMSGALGAAELRSSVRITSDREVELIEITGVASDPGKATDIANAFAKEFVKERQEKTQSSLSEAEKLLQGRIDALSADEAKSSYGTALKQQHDDIGMLLSMKVKDYEVLEQAMPPTATYFPRPFFNLLLGLAAGLIIGLIIAALLNSFDRRIKDQPTLERVMELPVLGNMPSRTAKRGGGAGRAVGFAEGNEALLEAMRMLRSNLKVLGFGDTKRSVLVTSTAPGEGKSQLAVNLALSMALAGDRAILVDADLRNPTVHRHLGIPNEQGLGNVLMERDSWSTKVQAVDLAPFVSPRMSSARKSAGGDAGVSKFLCLTSGSLPTNPTETLESEAMGDVLAELQGISDYVILDGPPMLVASDSLVLAQSVDAVILASTLGTETAAEAIQVRQLLARAEIPALGIVVCGAKPQRDGYYYYQPGRNGKGALGKSR